MVQNTVGKGEIACYEQFLLFPQCFLKTCIALTRKNQGLFGLTVKLKSKADYNYQGFNLIFAKQQNLALTKMI